MVTTKCSVKIQEIKFCLPIYQRYFFFFWKGLEKHFCSLYPSLSLKPICCVGGIRQWEFGPWEPGAGSLQHVPLGCGLMPVSCAVVPAPSGRRRSTPEVSLLFKLLCGNGDFSCLIGGSGARHAACPAPPAQRWWGWSCRKTAIQDCDAAVEIRLPSFISILREKLCLRFSCYAPCPSCIHKNSVRDVNSVPKRCGVYRCFFLLWEMVTLRILPF